MAYVVDGLVVDPGLSETPPRRVWDNPAFYLGVLVAAAASLGLLAWLAPALVWEGFVDPYLWQPIVHDEGFNAVNTTVLLLLAAFDVAWFTTLFRTYRQRVDLLAGVAGMAFIVVGAALRVLEDADLFAPFREDLASLPPGADAGTSCAPALGGAFLDHCAGALFVTPILWIWVGLALYPLARAGLEAERVRQALSMRDGIAFYAATVAVAVLLWMAAWTADPAFVRAVPPPWVAAAAGAASVALVAWRARREHEINWRWCLIGYAALPAAAIAYWSVAWPAGAIPGWPDPPAARQTWILASYAAVAGLVAWSARTKGRLLGNSTHKPRASVGRTSFLVGYILVLEVAALFVMGLGLHAIHDAWAGRGGASLAVGAVQVAAGPAAVALGNLLVARGRGGALVANERVAILREPFNVLMLVSQVLDGITTGLGVDVLGAQEKHVVPAGLIAWVQALGLPEPLASYPTALVMVIYKTTATLLAIWALDVWLKEWLAERPALANVVKLLVVAVGLGPATRNALRVALGT